ncbi:MAG: autotransporter outer membrane beta-barrel domain-containing protein [Planctomycetaceae bacterium]|nr:autotransporter outer membrane beta-barrel domain-containing protein [Planctomycetaceae bacterium]
MKHKSVIAERFTVGMSLLPIVLALALFPALCPPEQVIAENVTYPYPDSTLFSAYGITDGFGPSGSYSGSGGKSHSLSGNVVTVEGNVSGVYLRYVVGGYNGSDSETVADNTVIIKGDTRVGMFGGYSGWVSGGYATRGTGSTAVVTTSGNQVFLLDSASVDPINTSRIYGGFGQNSAGTAIASGNSVTISTSGNLNTVPIDGGFAEASHYALATGNNALLNNGATGSGLVGGGALIRFGDGTFSPTAESTFNTATVNNGTVTTLIGGDATSQYQWAGPNSTQIASNNTAILINGAVLSAVYGGRAINGTDGVSEASVNTVTIRDSDVRTGGTPLGSYVFGVIGGWAQNTGTATASYNAVDISGNTLIDKSVYGGYANSPIDAAANHNAVEINGNTAVNVSVYTGNTYGSSGSVYGGRAVTVSGSAEALNNIVTIRSGKVDENVYGGYATAISGTSIASNNIVTISGNPVFGANTILYGGYAVSTSGNSTSAGNIFNLHSRDITVAGLQDFQILNFYVPTTLESGGIMLNVTNTAYIDATMVHVGIAGSRTPLRVGDHVVLINAGTLDGKPINLDEVVTTTGMQGVSLLHEFELRIPDSNQNQLWAVLTKMTLNPQTEDFSKGFLAGMSLLNQGGDLVSWHGMSGVVRAARESRYHGCGIFFDMTGGWSRYNTGCHVDLSGLSLITGVAKYRNLRNGHLTLGMFFEHGNGSYDTYNTFFNADPVHGNGNLHYYGGGVLGRMDFNKFSSGHYYTEASFRAGGITNGYHNADIRDAFDLAASYDSASAYYGMHVGVGKYWQIEDKAAFDLYTKYLWTGLQGDSVMLSTGELVDFQRVNSHRLRVGWRYSNTRYQSLKPYLGAAWEYEFAGDARAATYGFAMDVPSLHGSTGICELGVSWKPASQRGLYVDLGAQGYAGKREGVSANLIIGKNF